jgi:uncharacterized membrane protein
MSTGILAADFMVPFFAVLMCIAPAVSRPGVQFGVRVPAERTSAPVIGAQRRAYYARTAAIGVCCTVAVLLLHGLGAQWLPRVILLIEIAADVGCMLIARKNIAAVKEAEHWFAGHRQTVVADTTWRADPPRFPVRWVIPAVLVTVATVVVGVLRYPDLPARLAVGWTSGSGRLVPKSVVSAFGVVAAQVYVTALWTGMMLLVYRSRPDIETADPAASMSRYRRFLAAFTKAVLALLALVDLSLLLAALGKWQFYRLSGLRAALPVLPFAAGLLVLAALTLRTGQGGFRLPGRQGGRAASRAAGTERDDDRFWKAGLIYVNRDDPALVVAARFGVGWTLNLGNRAAWLVIAGIVAVPAGLAAIAVAAGM